MEFAVLRDVAATFDRAIVGERGRAPDVDLARSQHATYRSHLSEAGLSITVIPADDDHPDCVFVEDTAVIVGNVAVITRPGAVGRRGETGPVAELMARSFPLTRIEAPGCLDGGDVMIMGETMWIGLSARSNQPGLDQLGSVAREQGLEVVVVPVDSVLHLKSAVLPVDPETVVVTPGTVDVSLLPGLRVMPEHDGERHRFSALPLPTGEVLVTDAAPRTAGLVASLGIDVVPIDVSEILAADGGLTCMSILYSR